MGSVAFTHIEAALRGSAGGRLDPSLADVARGLSDVERGTLLPLIWELGLDSVHADRAANVIAFSLRHGDTPAMFDRAATAAGIAALVRQLSQPPEPVRPNEPWDAQTGHFMRICGCLAMILHRLDHDLGSAAEDGLRQLLPVVSGEPPHLRLAVARLADDPAAVAIAQAGLIAETSGQIALAEWQALLHLAPVKFLQAAQMVQGWRHFSKRMEPGDMAAFLASHPDYVDFARSAMQLAVKRVEAIVTCQVGYLPDKAFTLHESAALGRVALVGLQTRADWFLPLLGTVWRGVAVAPNPQAKTMPSQSLTIVLANATVAEPQPEAVGLLKEVAKLLRHDGVKKKLERLVGAATSALAAFPERMLDFPTSEALPASLTRHYKLAVETLLSRPNAIPATEWLGRFGPSNRNGWALASQLIWQISEADGARTFAAILEGRAGRIAWRLVDDTLVPFDGDANVRMWHPVEVDAKETAIWCARIIATGVKQPFAQALRETYAPLAHELAGRQTALFAGQTVSAVPMIGLARRAGWRLGFQDELYMTLGGISFTFHAGIPAYPGSAGIGVTGSLSLNGPQDSLAKVPRRALSEVLRRVGLLVSVGATS